MSLPPYERNKNAMNGMYDGADEVETPSQNYFTEGKYLLEIEEIKDIEHDTKGKMHVAEFKVVESEGDGALRPGQTAAYFWKQGASKKDFERFIKDVKRFSGAVLGREPDEVKKVDLEKLASEAQPAKGERVRAKMVEKDTKSGGVFTKAYWMTA